MARNRIATKAADTDKGTVTFKWADGQTSEVNVDEWPEVVQRSAMFHGALQKLGDTYAGADDVESAREAFNATLDALKEGDWNRRGTGAGGPQTTQLMEAVSAVTGKDLDTVRERFQTLTDDEKKALRKDARIALALEKIKAARARERMKALADAAKNETGDLI